MRSIADVWKNVLDRLSGQLSETTIETWFDEINVVTMEDSAFVLSERSENSQNPKNPSEPALIAENASANAPMAHFPKKVTTEKNALHISIR